MSVYTNILSILDYRTAFQLAWQPLALPPLHTLSRVSSLKHISGHVIPLLKTFHFLLIGPKTLWRLIRLYIHRPLFTWYRVPLLCTPPTFPLGCNHSELFWFPWKCHALPYNIPLHMLFPCQEDLNTCPCLLPTSHYYFSSPGKFSLITQVQVMCPTLGFLWHLVKLLFVIIL